jgi:hypothetical protein
MNESLETRIKYIEDRQEISDLVFMYGVIMDERDFDGIDRLFSPDATLRSADGVFGADGLQEIRDTYQGRFDALGATNHFTHGNVIRFDDEDPDHAFGFVVGHAEVNRDGTAMWVALRYKDEYIRTAKGWQFKARVMSYMYYTPVEQYAKVLVTDNRVLAYGEATQGDWPDALRPGGDVSWIQDWIQYK